ncbi:hypothetical protein [Enterovibrio nigricans]|uniref:Uncharacterized protein n=1 Tax=Enterovibrio nigricans DSM 22720 TaxID=1121868 RepID=A0A1T4WEU0_9GAMM|nr:hypothetical protein [Enterovibrio nigricans]PKF48687.1 hypothetical protein AT251_24275 [Enterovibrio nigricans]SKA75790.1 hypothetical protein SAMN02745132_04905 [Enterovibrio nigricans DSM 22720]
MAQAKINPVRLSWTQENVARFTQAGFTSEIVQELTSLGELWRFDDIDIVIRSEGAELVWMATLGKGAKHHLDHILATAKRAGAKTVRFHVADNEKGIVRFWRPYHPVEIHGEGFDSGAFRVKLEVLS